MDAQLKSLTAEQAVVVRDYFIPVISTGHAVTRLMLEHLPTDKLDYKPSPVQQSLSEVVWSVLSTEDWFLTGITTGTLPAPEEKPADITFASMLAWYDEHFSASFQSLAALSGEELLRPVDLMGATLPAVEVLSSYMNTVAQLKGRVSTYLQAGAAEPPKAPAATSELTDEELEGVSGGVVMSVTYLSQTAQQLGWFGPPQVQDDFGATLAPATNSYGYLGILGGGLLASGLTIIPETIMFIFALF